MTMTRRKSALWFVITVLLAAVLMMIRAQASSIQNVPAAEKSSEWMSFNDKETAEEVAGLVVYAPAEIYGAAQSSFEAMPGEAVKISYLRDNETAVVLQKSLQSDLQPVSSEDELYSAKIGLTKVSYQGDDADIHFISWQETDEDGQQTYYSVRVLSNGFGIHEAMDLVNHLSESALNGAVQELDQ